jgi:hypothetical protein
MVSRVLPAVSTIWTSSPLRSSLRYFVSPPGVRT